MNQREKLLALAVGFLALATVATFGIKRVFSEFAERRESIELLNDEIHDKEMTERRGQNARRVLTAYEQRSLPQDPSLASSRYRDWLFNLVNEAGITEANVRYNFGRRQGDAFNEWTFAVNCEGDLRQLTDLLFRFYSTDYLHRIKRLTAKPLGGNRLSLAISIEALSLPGAEKDKELVDLPAERLAFADVNDYLDVIVARNPYAPANKPPRFASMRTQTAYLNQPYSFQAAAEDPENHKIRFRLGEHELEGLAIDEESGRVQFTPAAKGEFEIVVYATDAGMPPREVSQKIKIEVTDPPPPEAPPPPRPSFDTAKYAFVTGIIQENERPEVWIMNRTEGKRLRLNEGDDFEVGEFQGKVRRIRAKSVEIISEGDVISVGIGQSLSDGQLLDRADADVAAREPVLQPVSN
jgi:hypothetical protein